MDEMTAWGIASALSVFAVVAVVLYVRRRRRLFEATPTKTPTTRLPVSQYGGGEPYRARRIYVPSPAPGTLYAPPSVIVYDSAPVAIDLGSVWSSPAADSLPAVDTSSSSDSSPSFDSSPSDGGFSGGGGESGGGGSSGEV